LIAVAWVAIPAVAAADPLPQPVRDMDCLVGSWKGEGTLAMGKDKAKLAFTWSCARTSGDFGVLCTLHLTGIPGLASYDETDLLGFEPNSSTYHWYSVTNGGETHDHVAKPSAGNALEFVYTGTQEGKPFKEVIVLEFGKDKKSLSGRSETFVGGVSTGIMKMKATK
jgi:hypothetical protein